MLSRRASGRGGIRFTVEPGPTYDTTCVSPLRDSTTTATRRLYESPHERLSGDDVVELFGWSMTATH